jgi:polyhydroxybutyrate depolymerase
LPFVGLVACSTFSDVEAEAPRGRSREASENGVVSAPEGGGACTGGATDEGKQTLSVGGVDRQYILVAPKPFDGAKRYPIVLAFHGGGGSAEGGRSVFDFSKQVPEAQAWFVYPQAANGGDWDLDAPPAKNADMAFVDALVSHLKQTRCVDSARVYATGESRGGYFSNQLACARADLLRGIAPHAGGGPYGNDDAYDESGRLRCSGPVATMIFHGESDGTVSVSEAETTLRVWQSTNGCTSTREAASPSPCVTLKGCAKPTGLCRIPGLGHGVWSEGLRATWRFFDSLD